MVEEEADKDDYELMPHEEIERLRKEIDYLKKGGAGGKLDSNSSKDLYEAVEKLNANIEKLTKIFEDAEEEIIDEYKSSNPSEEMKKMSEQNEKIALGIVALAEMVKELKPNDEELHLAPKYEKPTFRNVEPPSVEPTEPVTSFSEGFPPPPEEDLSNPFTSQGPLKEPQSSFDSAPPDVPLPPGRKGFLKRF